MFGLLRSVRLWGVLGLLLVLVACEAVAQTQTVVKGKVVKVTLIWDYPYIALNDEPGVLVQIKCAVKGHELGRAVSEAEGQFTIIIPHYVVSPPFRAYAFLTKTGCIPTATFIVWIRGDVTNLTLPIVAEPQYRGFMRRFQERFRISPKGETSTIITVFNEKGEFPDEAADIHPRVPLWSRSYYKPFPDVYIKSPPAGINVYLGLKNGAGHMTTNPFEPGFIPVISVISNAWKEDHIPGQGALVYRLIERFRAPHHAIFPAAEALAPAVAPVVVGVAWRPPWPILD